MNLDLSIQTSNTAASFDRIAQDIFNHWLLQANESKFRLAEIEFYYRNENHPDPYVHGHELQKTSGQWYFHGSGIDLTFGDSQSFGGILIRAVVNIETNEYIYGPLNTVSKIFSSISSALLKDVPFGLVPSKEQEIRKEIFYKAPRVGLNPKVDKEYHDKNYRYLILPKEKHAGKTIIRDALIKQGFSEKEADVVWK